MACIVQRVPTTVFIPTVGNRRRTAARTTARVAGPAWEARANASRACARSWIGNLRVFG